MKKAICGALFLLLVGAGVVTASGPSSPARDSFEEIDALTVTQSRLCIVTEIRADGTVLIRDGEDKPEHPLPYSKKTRFIAQDKKQFDGKKKLAVADLKVGHELKVSRGRFSRVASQVDVRV